MKIKKNETLSTSIFVVVAVGGDGVKKCCEKSGRKKRKFPINQFDFNDDDDDLI